LLELCLASLVIFNKRRGGEASRLLMSAYTDRPVWSEIANQEIVRSLTDMEKRLLRRVDMVQVPGKRTRPVPILIMPVVREVMDVIVDVRRQHGINSANPCFFASDTAGGYIDHCRVLRELSRDAGVKRPELIRSTKLRKYMATVMQIASLSPGEVERLSNHSVTRSILTVTTIVITRVSWKSQKCVEC